MANYYNIDDILTEEELVPVVFDKAVNGVMIDPSSETNSVEQGAKVELPLWLSKELYLRQVVSISVPACFNKKTRMEIQADAACVDLKSRSRYFYEFGSKLVPLVGDKSIEVLLLSAFKIRYKEILTKAFTAAYASSLKFLLLLTREENNLYEAAQTSMAAFKKWRMGGPRLQRASVLEPCCSPALSVGSGLVETIIPDASESLKLGQMDHSGEFSVNKVFECSSKETDAIRRSTENYKALPKLFLEVASSSMQKDFVEQNGENL